MKTNSHAAYLAESVAELDQALGHLRFSASSCAELADNLAKLSDEELAHIEAFTSRFARVVDLMSKRVLRAIDSFEMYDAGTLLDVANRAEKRGLIESVEWLRELKDMRNRISHDYAGHNLPDLLRYCRIELPRLLVACDRISGYAKTLL
ncbi:MAG: HepT-like ribonuclease domain-containing protein [Luteolibacter sp.]